ncbi:MAG: energy-coupling factor transporter transmembrane protein EcfT [Oscillospiraceae bacterium]|nr:energy-coupling factor transporter transmembrane protein EcfT [Oscillospiraceae bacterium]
MKNDAFSGYHPAVNLAFFAAALGMTMFIQQPVYLLISMFSGGAYLLYLQGRRGMLRQVGYLLPILVMMAVMNPLFNHEGVTVLWYLPNDNPITLEAICFGLASAVMMGASIIWFNCCNTVFTSDKIIYLFGRLVPAMSLLISMTLRFVPRFKNFLQSVLRTQQAMHKPENTKEKLQQALAAFSATVSWAMEQSIVSADSMKSRGYGVQGRTAFSIYLFEKRDGITLAVLALLSAGAAVPHLSGLMGWTYYPSLSGAIFGPVQITAYLCYGGMCLLPLIIDLMEDHKWNSLRSKI